MKRPKIDSENIDEIESLLTTFDFVTFNDNAELLGIIKLSTLTISYYLAENHYLIILDNENCLDKSRLWSDTIDINQINRKDLIKFARNCEYNHNKTIDFTEKMKSVSS